MAVLMFRISYILIGLISVIYSQEPYRVGTTAGGFFAWLNIDNYGTDEEVTIKLWHSGIKVIPGSYLSINDQAISDSQKYIRIALVGNNNEIKNAANKINMVLE